MLIQFSITNFCNYKETATLDLSEAKITEMTSHLYRSEDGLRVLPMAAIYGPNGSGKTNFLKGIWTLRNLVLDAPSVSLTNRMFLFDEECKNAPIEFDILFRVQNQEYEYQLKITDTTVVEENLFGRDLTDDEFDVLFDRDSEGVFLCAAWENVDVSELEDSTPLLYFLGVHQKEELQPILGFFQNIIYVSGDTEDTENLTMVLDGAELTEQLCGHLKKMGLPIVTIRKENEKIALEHQIQGKSVVFEWSEESMGIRRLICILAVLLMIRKQGGLALADAPELQLHPKVLAYLYRLVSDTASSPKVAQVINATHENSNMNNSIFRRDELWFAAPQEDGSSTFYTLALFLKENGEKVRKDETYFKQYLEGRYGASPFISK